MDAVYVTLTNVRYTQFHMLAHTQFCRVCALGHATIWANIKFSHIGVVCIAMCSKHVIARQANKQTNGKRLNSQKIQTHNTQKGSIWSDIFSRILIWNRKQKKIQKIQTRKCYKFI